jgi:hypothetical protein
VLLFLSTTCLWCKCIALCENCFRVCSGCEPSIALLGLWGFWLGELTSILLAITSCDGKLESWCLLRTWGSCLKIDSLCVRIRRKLQIIWKQCLLYFFWAWRWQIGRLGRFLFELNTAGTFILWVWVSIWRQQPLGETLLIKFLSWLCYPRKEEKF